MRSSRVHGCNGSCPGAAWRRAAIGIVAIVMAAAPASAAAAAFAGAVLPRQTDVAAQSNKTVMIRVSCPKGTFRKCTGKLSVRTAQKVGGKYRSLGVAKFSIAAGKTGKVKVHLNAEGQKLIQRGKISPLATAASRDGHNRSAMQSRRITLESYDYANPPPYGGY